jgi:hypothetical protein
MAPTEKSPPETTGEFELPSKDAGYNQSRKGVSWSATPRENEQETVEKRKLPIKYKISTHLSVKTVLKETHTMFKTTDPAFLLVSKEDSNVIIRTATDIDKLTAGELEKYFPAELVHNVTMIKMFAVSSMPISRLKRSSFGYYKYSANHIWIVEDPFQSMDIRNIGFIIRKDPNKISREKFTDHLYECLTETSPFTATDEQRYNDAKTALPFDGPLPKFQVRVSTNLFHNSISGKVKTTAMTIHCDQKHVDFMSKLITSYYEAGTTDEKFVPHSLLHGNDPIHQKAYRNAIILQNKYLDEVRNIPVIGISPKALQETITIGQSGPQTVLNLLNQYHYFTSIEPTSKSDELGLYFFLTTSENFDKGKQFIKETLPKIWTRLNNTFLDELPPSVKCPRLTTSNLKDDSTSKTALMLAKAEIPDTDNVSSKWSHAPRINRPPTKAVIVNYTEQDFPNLKNPPKKPTPNRSVGSKTQPPDNQQDRMDHSSNHSAASATSGGTTFTREDGQSLFTSLTESFMSDIKSQTDAVLQQNKTIMAMVASQTEMREEQAAQNAKNDDRFERMLTAFMQHSTNDNSATRTTETQSTKKATKHKRKPSSPTPKQSPPSEMDIEHVTYRTTGSSRLPMEIDETTSATGRPTARASDQSTTDNDSDNYANNDNEFPFSPPTSHIQRNTDDEGDETSHSTAASIYQNYHKHPNKFEWLENGPGCDDENEWQETPYRATTRRNHPSSPTASATPSLFSSSVATRVAEDSQNDSQSFRTIDSDDPTHENYTFQETEQGERQTSNANKSDIPSPPQLSRLEPGANRQNSKTTLRPKNKSAAKMAKARTRLETSLQKASKTAKQKVTNDPEMMQITQMEPQEPNNNFTITPPRRTHIENEQTKEWSVVGSIKRKAKGSPAKPTPTAIRKSPPVRTAKKQTTNARASLIETPANQN